MNNVILLVEDNPTDEKLTILAFRKCGVSNTVVVERDSVGALDYMFGTGKHQGRDAAVTPRLVLLDIRLPKSDDLDVLKQLRADPRTQHVPVVVMTSSREEEDVLRSYALGANAYVRKPLEFAELATAAKTLGLFWLLLNELPPSHHGS